MILLNSMDLPTLGRPTMAIKGFGHGYQLLPLSCRLSAGAKRASARSKPSRPTTCTGGPAPETDALLYNHPEIPFHRAAAYAAGSAPGLPAAAFAAGRRCPVRQQARHVDGVAEEVVVDGHHLARRPGKRACACCTSPSSAGGRRWPVAMVKEENSSGTSTVSSAARKSSPASAASHAVFQLAVALVVVLLRQGRPASQKQLVGAEKAPGAGAPDSPGRIRLRCR